VRIARDLSLRETANKVGVSPTYLSRVENCLDPSPPTEKTLRALAEVLEDNLDELMRAREQNVTGAEFLEWLESKKKGGK
jgi:transcriptional regulator with XRE-family HTH domain